MPKLKLNMNNKQVGTIEVKNQTESSADLYFYGDIASESWQSECYPEDKCPKDVLDLLDEVGDVGTLNIHINSGGGSVFGGIAIYNILKSKKCEKVVYIDGIAASIASVIACVGDRIIMPENGMFMIHKPLTSYFWVSKNADDLRADIDALDACQRSITSVYMQNVKDGVTEDTITELINNETWLSGADVTDYFDFEIEESNNAAACKSNYFEKYKHTPDNLEKSAEPQAKAYTDEEIRKIVDDAIEQAKAQEKEEIKNRLLSGLSDFGK